MRCRREAIVDGNEVTADVGTTGGSAEHSPFRRLLVPLDGSRAAAAILPYVRRLASLRGTTIVLFQAVPRTIPVAAMEAPPPPAVLDADEQSREETKRYLEGVAADLRAEGFDAEWHMRTAEPAGAILELARELDADLIAMTTHGRTGLGRLVFGSVAEQVLRRSPAPVFLVRVAVEEPDTREA
jgi:nucleotide-binding universal stress UspA family protein